MLNSWQVASKMPEAPMQWPRNDLVETTGNGADSQSRAMALDSALSFDSVPVP